MIERMRETKTADEKREKRQETSRLLIAALVIAVLLSPWLRSQIFVVLNAERVENFYTQDAELPARLMEKLSIFEGEHDMLQFALNSLTFGYSGCYYSPDDVPLPFQNVDVPLVPDGEDRWVWEDGTDNHGEVRKLRSGWYYYKAWF